MNPFTSEGIEEGSVIAVALAGELGTDVTGWGTSCVSIVMDFLGALRSLFLGGVILPTLCIVVVS